MFRHKTVIHRFSIVNFCEVDIFMPQAIIAASDRCIAAKHLLQFLYSASERYFLKAAVTPSFHNHLKSSWIPSPSLHQR
jgi:hypothetical protein